jgi:hypothetical protein
MNKIIESYLHRNGKYRAEIRKINREWVLTVYRLQDGTIRHRAQFNTYNDALQGIIFETCASSDYK